MSWKIGNKIASMPSNPIYRQKYDEINWSDHPTNLAKRHRGRNSKRVIYPYLKERASDVSNNDL